jgi:SAM-dependent methyltransferase
MNSGTPRFAARPCPVCGSLRSSLLYSQSFEQLSEIRLLDGYEVVVCQDCGLAFADRIPQQSAFNAYYRDLSKYYYEYRGGIGTQYEELRFRNVTLNILSQIPDPGSRILEIGCSTGHLLSILKEQGYTQVRGVDPSPGCAKAAWDLYRIPVDVHTIFDIPTPDQPFDLLVLIAVMEHLRDLDSAIDKMRALLTPRGRVYLEVPDAANFVSNRDAPFQEFSLEHLNFFSEVSLTNLMQTRGFKFLSSNRFLVELSRGTWCASVSGIFEKSGSKTSAWARDEETEVALTAYINRSRDAEKPIRGIIDGVAASGQAILVWGTGTHTQRLLAVSSLGRANIVAFIDSNPKFQGKQLHGFPILAPEGLEGRREPILISSYAAQHEIAQQIREKLRLPNELILLYEVR